MTATALKPEPAASVAMAGDTEETCIVSLSGLQVMAFIGALANERNIRQPLIISVNATIIPPRSDSLDDTLDYNLIRDHAVSLAAGHIILIESYASELAALCLADPRVREVTVTIEKPQAVPGCIASVSRTLKRYSRENDRRMST